jgi:hypothetical protein
VDWIILKILSCFLQAADIATFIIQKRDLGTKAPAVETVEEKRQHLGPGKKFWSALGGLKTISCKCLYMYLKVASFFPWYLNSYLVG